MAKRSTSMLPIAAESQWKRRMIDALTDLVTGATTTEYKDIPLGSLHLEAFGNNAANGGILTTQTNPSIQQVSNKAPDVAWAAGQVGTIGFEFLLPYDYQPGTDVVLHLLSVQTGSNDDVDLDIECYVTRAGSAVSADRAPAVSSDNRLTQGGTRGTPEDIAITVLDATADFSQGDKLSFVITPDAHASDAVYLNAVYIAYTKGGALPDADQVYGIS